MRMVKEGKSIKEAGKMLGLTKGTAIGRIYRIRKAIEKYP